MQITEIKIKAQKLIEKGKLIGDMDLVNIGLDLLDTITEEVAVKSKPTEKENKKAQSKKNNQKTPIVNNEEVPDFTINKNKNSKKRKSVYGGNEWVNSFVDDGIEDANIITPELKNKTPRRPPVELVDQICSRCNRSYRVSPMLAADGTYRNSFICDNCFR